jgi:hypothetical protein
MSQSAQEEQSAELLKAWYQKYIATDGSYLELDSDIIGVVKNDELDNDEIERQVQQLILTTDVSEGFCDKCQHLPEHWPDLSIQDWAYAVGRSLDLNEIEAATRKGCNFCAFLLSRLKVTGLLDTYRKLEARLRILGDNGTASLYIQNWGNGKLRPQVLWINFPGKVAVHCNAPGAQVCQFESHIIPLKGKLKMLSSLWYASLTARKGNCGRRVSTPSML